jgi:hypothetical protein
MMKRLLLTLATVVSIFAAPKGTLLVDTNTLIVSPPGLSINDASNIFSTNLNGNVTPAGATTGRLLSERLADAKDPLTYGAVGDNVEDDTEELNAIFEAGINGVVEFPPNKIFKVTGPLTITSNLILRANNSSIYCTTVATNIIDILGDNVFIYDLNIVGSGNSSYDGNGKAIRAVGTIDDYIDNLYFENVKIAEMSGYAYYFEFVSNSDVKRGHHNEIGYTSVMALSCDNLWVADSYFGTHSPGTSSHTYSVAFTRWTTGDLDEFPRSVNCGAIYNFAENQSIWEMFDTHAGENILFMGNVCRDGKVGIAVVSDSVGNSPLNVQVVDNRITNMLGYGIAITGGADTLGSPISYAEGIIVSGNTLVECGYTNNANSGAIYSVATMGVMINNNNIIRPHVNGICFYYDNMYAMSDNNFILDPYDDNIAAPSGIAIRSEYNIISSVDGNVLRRDDTSLGTYVAERGINTGTTNNTTTYIGRNYNNFVAPYYGYYPSLYIKGADSTAAKVIIQTNGNVSIGADFGEYKLNLTGSSSTLTNLAIFRNPTAGGSANLQMASDSAQGGLRAFSSTHPLTRFQDTFGLLAESTTTDIIIHAENSGQRIKMTAGSSTPSGYFTINGWEGRERDTPVTPISGHALFYGHTNGLPYFINDDGTSYPLASPTVTNYTGLALGDLTTTITTGNGKAYWIAPRDGTIVGVFGSVLVASSSGAITYDIHLNNTTIMDTTKLTIDEGERSSVDATTPAVLSTTNFEAGDLITIDIDGAGANAAGPQVILEWIRR